MLTVFYRQCDGSYSTVKGERISGPVSFLTNDDGNVFPVSTSSQKAARALNTPLHRKIMAKIIGSTTGAKGGDHTKYVSHFAELHKDDAKGKTHAEFAKHLEDQIKEHSGNADLGAALKASLHEEAGKHVEKVKVKKERKPKATKSNAASLNDVPSATTKRNDIDGRGNAVPPEPAVSSDKIGNEHARKMDDYNNSVADAAVKSVRHVISKMNAGDQEFVPRELRIVGVSDLDRPLHNLPAHWIVMTSDSRLRGDRTWSGGPDDRQHYAAIDPNGWISDLHVKENLRNGAGIARWVSDDMLSGNANTYEEKRKELGAYNRSVPTVNGNAKTTQSGQTKKPTIQDDDADIVPESERRKIMDQIAERSGDYASSTDVTYAGMLDAFKKRTRQVTDKDRKYLGDLAIRHSSSPSTLSRSGEELFHVAQTAPGRSPEHDLYVARMVHPGDGTVKHVVTSGRGDAFATVDDKRTRIVEDSRAAAIKRLGELSATPRGTISFSSEHPIIREQVSQRERAEAERAAVERNALAAKQRSINAEFAQAAAKELSQKELQAKYKTTSRVNTVPSSQDFDAVNSKVKHSISKDKGRIGLAGMYVHTNKRGERVAVTTDGHRITITPVASSSDLADNNPGQIYLANGVVSDQPFPKYETVVPEPRFAEDIDKDKLSSVIDLAMKNPVGMAKQTTVRLHNSMGRLVARAQDAEGNTLGIAELGRAPSNLDLGAVIGVDAKYLKDAVRSSKTKQAFRITAGGPREPVRLDASDGTIHVIMPVRINGEA